jgi:3-hydroxymyristoyl/3-hydroxydecanoyl-(acyl carrier protein) dehydratase
MREATLAIGLLPYAPPMLLVDEVDEFDSGRIVISKVFDLTDPLVVSHLVGRRDRLVPGVLLIEMVGQAALLHQILRGLRAGEARLSGSGISGVLGRCKATFLRPALAGNKLSATVTAVAAAAGAVQYAGTVSCGNSSIANVEILAKLDGAPR